MNKPISNSQKTWNLLKSDFFLTNSCELLPQNIPPHLLTKNSPIDKIKYSTSTITPEELLCAYYIKKYDKKSATQLLPKPYTILADKAAKYHYLQTEVMPHCVDILPESGPIVTVANGGTICPQKQATI